VIVATAGHPFWSPATRTWVNASDLQAGDTLQTPVGEITKVIATWRYSRYHQVNNLTVARIHTSMCWPVTLQYSYTTLGVTLISCR
jgi:hypothetical protein